MKLQIFLRKLRFETLMGGARVVLVNHATKEVIGHTKTKKSLGVLVSSLGVNTVAVYCGQDPKTDFPGLKSDTQCDIVAISRGKATWFGPMCLLERKETKPSSKRIGRFHQDRNVTALIFRSTSATEWQADRSSPTFVGAVLGVRDHGCAGLAASVPFKGIASAAVAHPR